jgi:hypothetical protein
MLTCFDVVARVKHSDVRTRAYPPFGAQAEFRTDHDLETPDPADLDAGLSSRA